MFTRNGFFIVADSITAANKACRRAATEPRCPPGLRPGNGRIRLAATTPQQDIDALIAAGYVGLAYVLTTDGRVHAMHAGDPLPTASTREWAVVDMDGQIVSRHASREAAQARAESESNDYTNSRPNGDRSYLPRSVCHIACGEPRREGQYSTSWSSGCEHETEFSNEW